MTPLRKACRRELRRGAKQPNSINDIDWLWFRLYAKHEFVTFMGLAEYAGVTHMTVRRKIEHILWELNPNADYSSHWWSQWKAGSISSPGPTRKKMRPDDKS